MTYTSHPIFEWDLQKSISNRRKHGVSFEEVQHLFQSGVDYLEIYDGLHSQTEERFIALGPIPRGIVVVVWTERAENVIRIVSARLAKPREIEIYRRKIGDRNERLP